MAKKGSELIFLLSFPLMIFAVGRIYEKCELARELKKYHGAKNLTAPLVCIAAHESNYTTRLVKTYNESTSYGLFQINDTYWCSEFATDPGCNYPCKGYKDDLIADDYMCVKTILRETEKFKEDGFMAWSSYEEFCKGEKAEEFIKECALESFN